jgi:sortase A
MGPHTSLATRLLGAAIALLVGVAGGVAISGFSTGSAEQLDTAAAPPVVADPADADPVDAEAASDADARLADLRDGADAAAALITSLRAPLPQPEEVPADAYAPTPEVVHGTLHLPSIGVSQRLYEGMTLTAINRGPSLWPGTARPGQLGNVVVAGHRTTYTRPFYDLDLLEPGDELVFEMDDGSRHVYVLDRTEVVDETDIHIVDQSYAYQATLFACHPKGSARQRIVGHFSLADPGHR